MRKTRRQHKHELLILFEMHIRMATRKMLDKKKTVKRKEITF